MLPLASAHDADPANPREVCNSVERFEAEPDGASLGRPV